MDTKVKVVAASCLIMFGYAQQSVADWGDLLNNIGKAGQSLLSDNADSGTLDTDTIIKGLKEALSVGSQRAIEQIGQQDGFLKNPEIHIPLPPQVEQAGDLMRKFGMGQMADEFETSINRAAEKAAPEATQIMVDTIKNISIDDARKILNGPDDAATQYFKEHTSERLTSLFQPSIKDSLNQVGSTRYYNQLSEQIAAIPMVGQDLNVDLPDYVTKKALDGLFTMLAAEEQKIRENPTARTTELLKKVFQ